MNFWSKRIKNNKDIADALNVDEEKIVALKEGKLEIGGETMNKTLLALEEERMHSAIRDFEIWKWIQETDFRQKRLEFGYKTITEVAKEIGVSTSTLSRLENNKSVYPKLTPILKKVYDFYTNDFNKKVKNTTAKQNIDRSKKVNKENKDVWNWYKETNVKALRLQYNIKTALEFATLLNVCPSCISDLERKSMKRVNQTMIKAYNFFNNIEMPIEEDKDEVYEWYMSVDDFKQYRRDFGYSLNKFMSELNLSYDQARMFEKKEYKSATPVVVRAYNFYHDESKRLPKIEWEPTENNVFISNRDVQSPSKTEVDARYSDDKVEDYATLKAKIMYLEKVNEKYETLIDRLINKI